MNYRILDTTDGQHRGRIITINPGEKFFVTEDGDVINFHKFRAMGGDFYKAISFNYVVTLELVD
jgi:hypothetical protein